MQITGCQYNIILVIIIQWLAILNTTFSKNVEFKKYLHGVRLSDAGTRLLFNQDPWLNEELGRHRGREGKLECTLCGAECESVVHVLCECSTKVL